VPINEFRKQCRDFAQKWIDVQREEFKRLGVEGDWDNPYLTMAYEAEAVIVAEIGKFLMNGGLYRGSKPVMWSVVEDLARRGGDRISRSHLGYDLGQVPDRLLADPRIGRRLDRDLDHHALDHSRQSRARDRCCDRLRAARGQVACRWREGQGRRQAGRR
jgi:hypothetical protein